MAPRERTTKKITITLPIEDAEAVERLAASGQVESVSRYVTEAVAFRRATRMVWPCFSAGSASHRTTPWNGPAPSSPDAWLTRPHRVSQAFGGWVLGHHALASCARVEPYAQSLVWSAMEVGMAVAVPGGGIASGLRRHPGV
jgi:hypothetical protein